MKRLVSLVLLVSMTLLPVRSPCMMPWECRQLSALAISCTTTAAEEAREVCLAE